MCPSKTSLFSTTIICAALSMSAAPVLAQDSGETSTQGQSVERVYDPETGKYVSVTTKTGPNGATQEVVHKCVGGESVDNTKCATKRTVTNADGEVATRNSVGIFGENGFRQRQKTTGFDGDTRKVKRRGLRRN